MPHVQIFHLKGGIKMMPGKRIFFKANLPGFHHIVCLSFF